MKSAVRYQEAWERGVERVNRSFLALTPQRRQELHRLSVALFDRKQAMQELVSGVDAARHCADCQGACCVRGRYHFSAVDLLVYLALERPLFTPLFDNGLCPYLGGEGCLIPAPFRPFNCITFNCERIEDELAPEAVRRFYSLERVLREGYAAIRALFDDGAADGAVLDLDPLD